MLGVVYLTVLLNYGIFITALFSVHLLTLEQLLQTHCLRSGVKLDKEAYQKVPNCPFLFKLTHSCSVCSCVLTSSQATKACNDDFERTRSVAMQLVRAMAMQHPEW